MAIYMVDYENVKTGGLNGISRLTENDRVIIFYSENANRLTFDLHQRLMASPAKIEYREVTVGGHNALDFQLVSYLGFLIAGDPTGQYLIISNDRGFEYVVNFWKKENLQIGLLPYLKDPNFALQKASQPIPAEPAVTEEKPAEAEVIFVDEPAEEPKAEEPKPEGLKAEVPKPVESKPSEPLPAEPAPEKKPQNVRVSPSTPVLEEKIAPKGEKKEEPKKEPKKLSPKRPDVPLTEKIAPKTEAKKEQPEAKPEVKEEPKQPEPPKEEPKKEPKPKKQSAPKPKKEQPADPAAPDVAELLKDLLTDPDEIAFVTASVAKYKTKQGLNNAIMKKFGSQKAGEVYQALKPVIAARRGR